jgi:glycosyltransferase involved in cell wall biosynthesis
MLDATIIIATYNRGATLQSALASLRAQRTPPGLSWEAIIVDNNSTDDTRTIIGSCEAETSGQIRYLFEPRQGKTWALNAAIREARGEILAFTDDDVTLDPSWLSRLVGGMRRLGCAAAGGAVVPVWQTPAPSWLETEGPYRMGAVIVSFSLGDAPCAITTRLPLGANLAIAASVVRRLGAFRTDLGPTVGSEIRGEDSEICQRLLDAGERIVYLPDAIVQHPVDARRLDRAYFQRYYFAQGRAVTRYEGVPAHAVCVGGVPRYLLKAACVKALRWITARGTKPRFYHRLQFLFVLGRIAEARSIGRRAASPHAVPVS